MGGVLARSPSNFMACLSCMFTLYPELHVLVTYLMQDRGGPLTTRDENLESGSQSVQFDERCGAPLLNSCGSLLRAARQVQ